MPPASPNVRNQPLNCKGFTIAEVLVALLVMMAGVVGMIQAISAGGKMLETSRKQALAAQIIQGQIDEYRLGLSANWSSVSTGTSTVNLATTSFSSVASGFTCSRTVANVKSDGSLKQVTYTVSWTGLDGRAHTRTGSTYIGKHGLHVSYQRS